MSILPRTVLLVACGSAVLAFADSATKPADPVSASITRPATELGQEWMVEGEKRYRTNCGRCHQAPHKFPPRTMATAVRHMRVRALLTEEDMKYVLYYLTH